MKSRIILFTGLLMLFLPLLLVAYIRGLMPILHEFPIRTHYIEQPAFSLPVFSVFAVLGLIMSLILLFPSWFGFASFDRSSVINDPPTVFPPWGWAGIILCATSWIFAWGQFGLLDAVNDYYFFPLWLGYILTVDALVFRRTRISRLAKSPRMFFLLFPASALAWWYFEFVNRFVQNWWYTGVEDYSSLQYLILATVSFSTVFPAVFETHDLLKTFPWFKRAYAVGPKLPVPGRSGQIVLLGLGIAALAVTGWKPTSFFYLTWFTPLVILGSALALADMSSPLSSLRNGDYSSLFTFAVSALICGWFWEMWNYYSMPKWYYTVPYVMRFKVFEMPAPGYGGYLPFGPICCCLWLAMCGLVGKSKSNRDS